MRGNMDFITGILEVLVIVLVAIEIVELSFNIRATRTHEKSWMSICISLSMP